MTMIDPDLKPDEAASIAEEAYLYAYPMLIGYGFFHRQILGPDAPEKQAVNRFTHFRTLSSPTLNNTIPWINTDTLYSAVWLDLRAQPIVLSTPELEPHRFHDVQANDWFTMALFTRGTRDRGNGAAVYMIAGPTWSGEPPTGVTEIIRADSWIVKLFARIVVEGPGDEVLIHVLQDSYRLEPLSDFLGRPAPPKAPSTPFLALAPNGYRGPFFEQPSPDFISTFNFLMTLARVHPDETNIFAHFARIGIAPGADFKASTLPPDLAKAIQRGIDAAGGRIRARLDHLDEPVNGWLYPLDLRGGRDILAGNTDAYLRRAVAAKFAIWGPQAEEVVYMSAEKDADGDRLDGNKSAYRLTFDRAPPAKGFWSVTVYDAATRLLVPHPSGRYKLGDRNRDMVRGENGSLTIHFQHDEPKHAPQANWLPIPKAPFQVVARLYWPEQELLDRRYLPPGLKPCAPR
ncbi:MAG: DUF1254 domain-containing protein [Rhizomicrobium sp.]